MRRPRRPVRLAARIGSIELPNPVMTASGTAGHGAELAGYGDLGRLGAVVVKSLAAEPWPGNPAPRLHEAAGGMLNSVGLQGPGVEAWLEDDLPALVAAGTRVVASIWGRTVEDYAKAATALAAAPAEVVAVEVNLSCPNLEGGRHLFAQSPRTRPERWSRRSPVTVHCGRSSRPTLRTSWASPEPRPAPAPRP